MLAGMSTGPRMVMGSHRAGASWRLELEGVKHLWQGQHPSRGNYSYCSYVQKTIMRKRNEIEFVVPKR